MVISQWMRHVNRTVFQNKKYIHGYVYMIFMGLAALEQPILKNTGIKIMRSMIDLSSYRYRGKVGENKKNKKKEPQMDEMEVFLENERKHDERFAGYLKEFRWIETT